jgi:hypothetical protein
LKTLFFQLFADVILALYLYEYGANKLVVFFQVLDIVVDVWKLSRTYSIVLRRRFPFVGLETSELYKKREKIDQESIWYMNYLLVPLMALYLAYSLYRRNWTITNYYLFALETAVAFIALFGFILMTPQLYMNYKLQSVDHINWRGLIYRFITTIIDDLFAFMVTMPFLRRIMYFRDGRSLSIQISSSLSMSISGRSTRLIIRARRCLRSRLIARAQVRARNSRKIDVNVYCVLL